MHFWFRIRHFARIRGGVREGGAGKGAGKGSVWGVRFL